MNYSLLDLDDYEQAPAEPHRKFAVLEWAARRRMNEIMDRTESGDLAVELRNQYMNLVIAMADALGIPGVTYPEGDFRQEWQEHQAFTRDVQGVIARIMLNNELVAGAHSVQLATATKAKIEGQLTILRGMIENSDMPAARRTKLIAQLDDFAAELNRPRLNYTAVAVVATAFLASIQGITSTLADAPNAYQTVGTILKWVGQNKDAEDRERERLGTPTPMLAAPTKPSPARSAPAATKTPSPTQEWADDLDDDKPF